MHAWRLTFRHRSHIGCLFFLITLTAQGQGIVDLREHDFDKTYSLGGLWEFYWQRLTVAGGPNPVYCEVPMLWDGQVIGLDTLGSMGYATYRIRILLPESDLRYGLFIDDLYSAYRLFVNGNLVGQNGRVGADPGQFEPEWRPQVYALGQLGSEIEIVLQVANFVHSKGGISKRLRFGRYEVINRHFQTARWFDLILAGILAILAIIFLIRFGFISLDFASLYFALFCIAYGYRLIGSDLYPMYVFFKKASWTNMVTLEYLAFFLGPFFFSRLTRELYPEDVAKPLLFLFETLCIGLAALTLLTEPFFYTSVNQFFIIVLAICFFYGFVVYLSAYLNRRAGASFGVISAVVIFSLFSFQLLAYTFLVEFPKWISLIAHLMFIYFQTRQLVANARVKQLLEV